MLIDEIVKTAAVALNSGVEHYFHHLSSGENKKDEAVFIAETMKSSQVWLFFTEGSMDALRSSIYKSQLFIDLVYNLSTIFHQRFLAGEEDYKTYVKHLSWAFDSAFSEADGLSLMAPEYRDRLVAAENTETLLASNRPWVFLATMILYLDTNIIIEALQAKK